MDFIWKIFPQQRLYIGDYESYGNSGEWPLKGICNTPAEILHVMIVVILPGDLNVLTGVYPFSITVETIAYGFIPEGIKYFK